ncbi:GntR family transcriptional regulator [Roseisalinus antarcticus]|uniref:Putative HTH-type transcriptional regulator YdfH n=1 Tax=Roseisalinus antarcticus TaxID=254357 RepID=A0A1Y5U2U3_9RHOB|nr:GntR family transcriptional regulator [Roseisalinus antarcticus]SLN77509.1 putative HTH-type transcriptional regulator YdfH [Roseisalinus antarcticus]
MSTTAKRTKDTSSATRIIPEDLLVSIPQTHTRSGRAYAIMRRAIIEMVLEPGSIVNEKAICAELGVSRTPLREALLKLQDESLVRIEPATGTFVARIDLETVFEGHLIRRLLELEMVKLGAQRMTTSAERNLDVNLYKQKRVASDNDFGQFYELDEEFHEIITGIGASHRVWRVIHSAKAQLDRVRRLAFPLPSHLETILSEHEAIVMALKMRNPEKAAEAMDRHLSRVFKSVQSLIADKTHLFTDDARQTLEEFRARSSGTE